MEIKSNLIETVARALHQKDISEEPFRLTDQQFEALKYFIEKLKDLQVHGTKENRKYFLELLRLKSAEERNKPILFLHTNNEFKKLQEEEWVEYKKYAEVAIEAYDKWLENKQSEKHL